MSLLSNILRRQAAARHISADDRKARRRLVLAMDSLEERKVLSTVAPSSGTFEGMAWSYSENAQTHVGTLNFTSKPGSDRIQIQAQHVDLSPGDPGYNPNSNPVNGVTWAHNDDQGGVNITPGTHVNITVKENVSDDQFVNNDKTDFTLSTVQRTTTVPTGPTGPTGPTQPVGHPGTAQSGTSLGLAWRFAPDGSASGGGTLYVQDVAKGADSVDPGSQPIAINQDSGHMILDVDYTMPFYGPSVAAGAKVNIVVADHSGDIQVYDDRGGAGTIKHEDRHQTGSISVPYGSLTWAMDSNVVTQQATFTINSGKSDHSVYNINATHLDLSPGDPGYNPNSNPIVGLQVTDSGNESGGPSFLDGVNATVKTNIKIVTTGGATFKNNSGF